MAKPKTTSTANAATAYATVIETLDQVGKTVTVRGWVHTIRDMGKIVFIELRDYTGVLQVVVADPGTLPKLGAEYVVAVTGEVRARGERFVNEKLATGTIELGAAKVEVLNESAELPFEIKKDTSDVHEELRLKYRYLDIRSQRMTDNLKLRHRVISYIRRFYDDHDFIEVETPLLTKGTPEGAREFLVPSRLHPERFYVLPQSPQQFKQLLMIAGLGRYYQIAKCLRDEDQRGDRQPEFTQLDVEMSFVTQEDVLQQTEAMLIGLVKAVTPHKQIQETPFPRLTYAESMERYGNDKPDLRKDKNDPNELAFAWVTDFPMFDKNKQTGQPDAMHHPFTAPLEKDPAKLKAMDPFAVASDAYDIVLNGYEIGGGSIRISNAELQQAVFEILGLSTAEITERFGHMLEAYRYGAPPHGGIAPGLDRIVMILAGEPNIREVIAFPKTGDARDPLTGAPTTASAQALAEAHIKTVPPKSR
jgi:aspartyl-tRNA synthetase